MLLALAGCEGRFDELPPGALVESIPKTGARRLTREEYDNSVQDILGDTAREAATLLPDDTGAPFDNDYVSQVPSQALVDGADLLAERITSRLLLDIPRRNAVMGCAPAGPGDTSCFRSFVSKVGRRLFRRPLTADEISRFVTLQSFSLEAGDFYEGAGLVLRAMLQHPSFLYRVENRPATSVASTYPLDNFEIASRISYFLWASAPDEALLAQAENQELVSPEGRRKAAQRLLADPRAQKRIHGFFGRWLGYSTFKTSSPDLTQAMGEETTGLIEKVIMSDRGSLLGLFRSTETLISPLLATHYGLPFPTGPSKQWVPYGSTGRRGILSHGSILAAGAKFGDTSPTLRGKFIRNRLLCTEIPLAPAELMVNIDQPPTVGHCKADRYKIYQNGVCQGCHSQMDPIGFGLEAYDAEGRFRTYEKNAPDCPVSGVGEIAGVGKFTGPAGLSQLLIDSGQLESCAVTQVFRLAFGRRETSDDKPLLQAATQRFKEADDHFLELLTQFVSSDAFVTRKEE